MNRLRKRWSTFCISVLTAERARSARRPPLRASLAWPPRALTRSWSSCPMWQNWHALICSPARLSRKLSACRLLVASFRFARECVKTKGKITVNSLEEWLLEQGVRTIETIATYIEQYVCEHWHPLFEQNQEDLVDLYQRAGEAAYGRYAVQLFRPLQEQLTRAGFTSSPSFR